ncbi:MAG: bifunctional oligoribonuclease/PAP phosphatase NrnA [Anaerolineales bacterium]|nr:bifunctional oligoribonuclease/PAP phosphatase NrnA [Anaerolineales bacterium]
MPPESSGVFDRFSEKIQSANRILIVSHIRPDGDAVGSLLGLGLVLEEMGKKVNTVLEDGVPLTFHFLYGHQRVYKDAAGVYDLVIVVDCSDVSRVGSVLDEIGQPDVNIDHHPTNTMFASLNIVQKEAVATAEIIYKLIQHLSLPLNKPIAEALLTGIIMDSLGFRTSNTTSQVLRIAADLQEQGANISMIHRKALLERSYEAVKYWGAGLSKAQKEGRLVWATLSLEDRDSVGYPGRDDADLVNILSTIKETDICIVFVEQRGGSVKISWRAKPGFDVSRVALQFGGGGHKPAAGAEIRGELKNIKGDVIRATKRILGEEE